MTVSAFVHISAGEPRMVKVHGISTREYYNTDDRVHPSFFQLSSMEWTALELTVTCHSKLAHTQSPIVPFTAVSTYNQYEVTYHIHWIENRQISEK